MPSDTASLFAEVIQEHLELKRRNAALERDMPLEKYMTDDPFENHPLFKTEEQARVEDTLDGVQSIVDEPTSLDWPSDDTFIDSPAPAAGRQRTPRPRTPRSTRPTRASGRARATSTGATSSARRARRAAEIRSFSRLRAVLAPSALAWLRSPGGCGLGMGPGPSLPCVEDAAASRSASRRRAGSANEAGVAGYPVADGRAEDLDRLRPDRRPAARDRDARRRARRGRALPDAARRDRHRQDRDDGLDHRADCSGPRS